MRACYHRDMTTALRGHKVLLGVSGGIASYKSATLARRLIDAGAEVRVVMTAGAQAFVTSLTFQALTGKPVHADLLDPAAEAAMGHIELARWADSVLIAPASANTIARLAGGFADDLLSTLCLATDAPLYLAPAMNRLMWAHAATRENVARLSERGVVLFGPDDGAQACGEVGSGRMSEPEELRDRLAERIDARRTGAHRSVPQDAASRSTASRDDGRRLAPADGADASASPPGNASVREGGVRPNRERRLLEGLSVVITAGPTREAIDPVRYVSNRSSGRMGYAMATAALAEGARVTLVSGPVSLATPAGARRIDVSSAREMREAVLACIEGSRSDGNRSVAPDAGDPALGPAGGGDREPDRREQVDVFIAVAAVSDYRVADVAAQKIKKKADTLTLAMVRNPDILAEVAALPAPRRPFCVGFAAETEHVGEHARGKLARKRLDMIAANHVARPGAEVFGSDTNALDVYWTPDGHARIDTATKAQVAEALLALIAERLQRARAGSDGHSPDGRVADTRPPEGRRPGVRLP